jgi:putative membrane protein insertion efficiency factor
MTAPRPARKNRRSRIKLIAAVALAAAAVFDWSRPPERQLSVPVYEAAVINPYRWFGRPISSLVVRCRYRPTCSQYSLEAVKTHGFPIGIWLTTKRLFRCMPWVPLGTLDPVPPRAPRKASAELTAAASAPAIQVHEVEHER